MKALKDFTWHVDGKVKFFKKGTKVDLSKKDFRKAVSMKLVEEPEQEPENKDQLNT